MPAKPQGDDDGFPTSAELSRLPDLDKEPAKDDVGRFKWLEDPWHELRIKKQKAKEKRERLLKRYRDGKL